MYQILPMNMGYPISSLLVSFFCSLSLLNFWFILSSFKLNFNSLKLDKKFKLKQSILSLFVSFDPNTNMKLLFLSELNWFIVYLFISLYFYSFWSLPSRMEFMKGFMLTNLSEQFSIALKSMKDGTKGFFNTFFIIFMLSNILGLIPYVFTCTSHITFNLFIALPLWLGFFLYGWMNFTNKMLAHLVPLSTPKALIAFMVLIELMSTFIRPGTLGIRLMANMVSGHLLLTLMGNSMVISPFFILIILIMLQTVLSILEVSVSLIQAYVFCILLTLYSDDSDYKN